MAQQADQAKVKLTYAEAARLSAPVAALKKVVVELDTVEEVLDKVDPDMEVVRKAFVEVPKELKKVVSGPDMIAQKGLNKAKETREKARDLREKTKKLQKKDHGRVVQFLSANAVKLRKTVEVIKEDVLKELCDFLRVGAAWRETLLNIFKKANIECVFRELKTLEDGQTQICPPVYNLFSWTRVPGCGPNDVKVVIIGQNPEPDPSATGIAFMCSTEYEVTSIRRLLEMAIPSKANDDRPSMAWPYYWCTQGVLLINNVATISKGGLKNANLSHDKDHKNVGWEKLTKHLIERQLERDEGVVFVQLGREAENNLKELMVEPNVYVDPDDDVYNWVAPNISIVLPHPSADERLSSEVNLFTVVNDHLTRIGKDPIRWDQCHFPGVIFRGQEEARRMQSTDANALAGAVERTHLFW